MQNLLHGVLDHGVVVEGDETDFFLKFPPPALDLIEQRRIVCDSYVPPVPQYLTLTEREVKVVLNCRQLLMSRGEFVSLLLELRELLFDCDARFA